MSTSSLIYCFVLFQGEKRASSPFRRVREEDIEVDSRVADNSFDAKVRERPCSIVGEVLGEQCQLLVKVSGKVLVQ